MSTFIAEQIHDVSQIQSSPVEGPMLAPPDQIIDDLKFSMDWSKTHREAVTSLLDAAGAKIEWVEGEDERFAPANMPENHQDLMTNVITEKQAIVKEMYDNANEHLGEYKSELVGGLARYGKKLGIDDSELEKTLAYRIENIDEIKVDAPISQGRIGGYVRDSAAHFDPRTGQLRLNVGPTINDAEHLKITTEQLVRRNVLHELLHGASVRATQDSGWNIKAGLGVMPAYEGSGLRSWTGSFLLDEGTQEDIRWKELDGTPPSYEESVMFWEMMKVLDPEIEKLRFEAKFLNKGRGQMIGHIESILGPSAVEEIEEMLQGEMTKLVNYPGWKTKMVEMIDIYDDDPVVREKKTIAARIKAREVLDQTQLEIYASRGWDYSDEQLIKAKENGAKNAVDIEAALA